MVFVNGVATFAGSEAPTIDLAGTYTLTVSPVAFSQQTGLFEPANSATPITTAHIKIGGDHLVYLTQPPNSDVNVDIPFKLVLENAQNKVDTTATTDLQVTMNTISGGTNAELAGTAMIPFVDGVAQFPAEAADQAQVGLSIDTPGTYTFTATEMEQDPDTAEFAPSTTSDRWFPNRSWSAAITWSSASSPAMATWMHRFSFTVDCWTPPTSS